MATKENPVTNLTIPEKFKLGDVEVNRDYLNKQVEELCKLSIDGVNDTPGYKLAVMHRASFRTTRTTLEKVRKEMSAPHQEYVKNLKAMTDELGAIAFKGEEYFDDLIKAVDGEKERIKAEELAAAQRKLQGRTRDLNNLGATFDGETYILPYDNGLFISAVELYTVTDAGWEQFIEDVKQSYATEQQRLADLLLAEQARELEAQQERDRIKEEGERQVQEAESLIAKRTKLRLKEATLLGFEVHKSVNGDGYYALVHPVSELVINKHHVDEYSEDEWETRIAEIENWKPPVPLETVVAEFLSNPSEPDYSALQQYAEELSKDNPTVVTYEDEYIPFGDEWLAEIKKWNKQQLIDKLRETLIELQKLKARHLDLADAYNDSLSRNND